MEGIIQREGTVIKLGRNSHEPAEENTGRSERRDRKETKHQETSLTFKYM